MSESTLIQPEPSLLRTVPREDLEDGSFRKEVGCKECSFSGFSGRYAITEILVVNEVLRVAIMQKLPTRSLPEARIITT